ncbi:eukaryotic translation initiation factor 5B-like [Microplitis mediator]|uniref:eukaryotic translation initiation factor 5B-like n=1 Tax=Microplitis mediator TaxID=375433 RepID=UPI002556BA95|nr:eukaryotic translation initiation factor 5B-like [Microplitis mediator]
MSRQCCLICASDEGFFLDIYLDGKNFRENIEKCLSAKIKKGKLQSTKLCHKCAYEIDQCSKFVDKYKKARDSNEKPQRKRGCCNLCMEAGPKGLIFSLSDDDTLNNPQKKLHAIFNDNYKADKMTNISICLNCRYNVDVLYDLKCIYENSGNLQQIIDEDSEPLSDSKKIKTHVVKRKTTLPKSSKDIIEISDSESCSSVTNKKPKKAASSFKSKSKGGDRECDECHDVIEAGVDMYRYHHTGCKVCKDCWLKVDPNEMTVAKKRRKLQKPTSTKLCSVFLEDIFVGPPENKKKGSKCKTKDAEVDYDDSDDVEDEAKTKKNLKNSKLKTKSVQNDQKSPKKSKVVPKKRSTKNSLQNNDLDKKIKQEVSPKSPEVTEKTDRTRITKSRLNALRDKKIELSKVKSENLKKSQQEQRRKKLQKKLRQSRSRDSPVLSPTDVETSEPQKTQEDKDLSMDVDSDSESGPYTCNICNTDFENRVEGLKHELTHSKKLGVVLEKFAVADDETNEPPSEDVTDKSVSEPSTLAEESHVSDVSTLKSNETKIDDEAGNAVDSKTNEVDGKQSMETSDDKENPPEDVSNDSDKKVVDCNEENDVTEKLIGDEKNTDVDEKDVNVDVEGNNIRAEDSNFETKNSGFDADHSDVNEQDDDGEKKLRDKETNAETDEINEPSKKESDTENMTKESEAEDKEKDDDSGGVLTENDSVVENAEKNENHVQQKEETNNVDEDLSESVAVSDKKVEEPNNQIHVDDDNDEEEKKSSQSEEDVNESSKLSCNTEKLGIVEGCENDEKLIENKAETENKLVEYESSLKVDEKIENLEPSIDTGTEKDENNRVDKLQKIIDASFGDSLQE